MPTYKLQFELLSAATFGRGDGVAGLVDREVERDAYGLPFLRGRTLKGLLAEECANILYAVDKQGKGELWRPVAYALFGRPGSMHDDLGQMRVSDARLPESLRESIEIALQDKEKMLTSDDVLESLTAIRRQTSMDKYGAPERGSLRSMRVVLPGAIFEAQLEFAQSPDEHSLALLAACVLAWRRAGTGRNRGRGKLFASLHGPSGEDITEANYRIFAQEVTR